MSARPLRASILIAAALAASGASFFDARHDDPEPEHKPSRRDEKDAAALAKAEAKRARKAARRALEVKP